jgi:ribokinase
MIVVAGSANLDFVVRAAHIPAPGETVLGQSFQTFPGGKGANQAVACARAGGAATTFLGAVGADDFAKPLIASLQSAGVQLQAVTSSEPTGTAFICVADSGENAITVAPGANATLAPTHWPQGLHCTHLLMQLETPLPTVLAFAQAARVQEAQVVLNAAPARELPPELLRLVNILVVNEGELATLAEGELATLAGSVGNVRAQLQRLADQHRIETIIVTLGGDGCLALHKGQWLTQKAFPITVVDTTGAGDTFCGALVAALSRQSSLQQALLEASAAAALACTRMGAQSSIPERAAVQEFIKQYT